MTETKTLQENIMKLLGNYFHEVKKEWVVSLGATDDLHYDIGLYIPRLDIAVGPFNVGIEDKTEKIEQMFAQKTPQNLKDFVECNTSGKNRNPRCTISIELELTGSPKIVLGDIANASMMGLYGFVIGNQFSINRLRRVYEYTKTVRKLDKTDPNLFSNVCVMLDKDFMELIET